MVPMSMSSLVSLIQKRFFKTTSVFSNSPLPTSSSSSSITVQFLTDTCGLPLESALSVSKKFQIQPDKLHNSQSVLQLFKAHHFSDSHIVELIKKLPRILHSSVELTLKPKLDFFVINGIVGKFLPHLIATNPSILHRDLDSCIKPHFEFFKSILGCNEDILAVLKRVPWLFSYGCKDNLQQNVDFLRKEGVPFDRVAKLFRLHPSVLKFKHDRVVCAVNAVKNLGIKPEATGFVRALGVMIELNESRWKEKTEMMESLGWSKEEVFIVFKRYPSIFTLSDKKIRTAMHFFMNTMKLEHNVLTTYPYFLTFSIDKRIRPRYNVIRVLLSKKLIKLEKNICNLLVTSEKKFLEKYVTRYADEVPYLLEIYLGTGKQNKR